MSSPVNHAPDEDQRKRFWEAVVRADVVGSSFRRGNVFQTKNAKKRAAVRETLFRKLVCIGKGYVKKSVCGEAHVCNIEKLAHEMTTDHENELRCGGFRFGTAQKALNLYLKHAWLHGYARTLAAARQAHAHRRRGRH